MKICNSDLYNKKYDLVTLKEHIFSLSLIDIIKTQYLTSDFCVKYVLNVNFQLTKEEENITIKDIVEYQPHISYAELVEMTMSRVVRTDSFEDFETYTTRHMSLSI